MPPLGGWRGGSLLTLEVRWSSWNGGQPHHWRLLQCGYHLHNYIIHIRNKYFTCFLLVSSHFPSLLLVGYYDHGGEITFPIMNLDCSKPPSSHNLSTSWIMWLSSLIYVLFHDPVVKTHALLWVCIGAVLPTSHVLWKRLAQYFVEKMAQLCRHQ